MFINIEICHHSHIPQELGKFSRLSKNQFPDLSLLRNTDNLLATLIYWCATKKKTNRRYTKRIVSRTRLRVVISAQALFVILETQQAFPPIWLQITDVWCRIVVHVWRFSHKLSIKPFIGFWTIFTNTTEFSKSEKRNYIAITTSAGAYPGFLTLTLEVGAKQGYRLKNGTFMYQLTVFWFWIVFKARNS